MRAPRAPRGPRVILSPTRLYSEYALRGVGGVRGRFHVNTGSFSLKKVSIRILCVSCLYPIVFKNTCLILCILDVYSCSKIPDCILKCVFSCINNNNNTRLG